MGWGILRSSNRMAFTFATPVWNSPGIGGTTLFTDALNLGWHHVAVVRTGDTFLLFVDGIIEASNTFSPSPILSMPTSTLGVAARASVTTSLWVGWIDEFRLSVGIARWTTNFTPQSGAYSAPSTPAPPEFHYADFDGEPEASGCMRR